MRRREFITLLGAIAAAWPLAARAQQSAKVYRIGYLSPTSFTKMFAATSAALGELGWIEGKNVV
jgi:putative tryptophan/tyrosine transport system substrate-binding protein